MAREVKQQIAGHEGSSQNVFEICVHAAPVGRRGPQDRSLSGRQSRAEGFGSRLAVPFGSWNVESGVACAKAAKTQLGGTLAASTRIDAPAAIGAQQVSTFPKRIQTHGTGV